MRAKRSKRLGAKKLESKGRVFGDYDRCKSKKNKNLGHDLGNKFMVLGLG